jgi:hypothetical protein
MPRLGPLRAAFVCAIAVIALAACQREGQSAPPAAQKPAAQPPAPPPPGAQAPAAPQTAFKVTRIDLGKQLRDDKQVAEQIVVFAPADTIYASVVSEGAAASVTLQAKWTFEDGQLVSESSQTIAPTGAAATEFHIARPSGWPAGKYRVDIAANGAPVGARMFEVREAGAAGAPG